MKNKQSKILVGVILVISIACIVGFSYAYFSAIIKGSGRENIVKAGSMVLEYTEDDNGQIIFEGAEPGKATITKKFKVENTGTLPATYNIKISDIVTTFKGQDLKYTFQETESDYTQAKGSPVTGYINVGTGSSGTIYLKTSIDIESTIIHYYTLTVEFQELDINQNYNQGATFTGKVNIDTGEAEAHILSYTDYCGGMENLASCMLKYADKFESFIATDDPDANARYMGADPNNYVYFNCSDYNNPTKETCELWRIIGSFNNIELADSGGTKNLVKIIRNDNLAKDANIVGIDMSSQIDVLKQSFDQAYNSGEFSAQCPSMDKDQCFRYVLQNTMGVDPDNPKMYGLSWDISMANLEGDVEQDSIYTNNWTTSSLMKTLNEGFESNNVSGTPISNSLYWSATSGKCWTASTEAEFQPITAHNSCDFTKTGLKESTHEMIEKVKWHLGGLGYSDTLEAQSFYKAERGTTTYNGQPDTWEGKVALMYPSDYLYATSGNSGSTYTRSACLADENGWYKSGTDYSDCYNNDWLLNKNNSNSAEWTLAPYSVYSYLVFGVHSGGYVYNYGAGSPHAVRPSLYLNSRVSLVGGFGTESNPYVIKSA